MSESGRQAPEYGEYASDEERASALERSGVDPTRVEEPDPLVKSAAQRSAAVEQITAPSPRRAIDRLATIFLLSFGIVSIIGGAPNYFNLGATLHEMTQQFGMGEYHPPEQTVGVGIAMIASQTIIWAAAAVWSYRRISRGKLAWWVPILAGVLSIIVLSVLLGSVLAADPSFVPTLSKL